MKKVVKLLLKTVLFVAWFLTIPLLFAIGIIPLTLIIVFICWFFDEDHEHFWKHFKEEVSELWDYLSFKNIIGEDE